MYAIERLVLAELPLLDASLGDHAGRRCGGEGLLLVDRPRDRAREPRQARVERGAPPPLRPRCEAFVNFSE